ncbi:MAG TPA: hypothetical protein VIV11_20595 [Kofleriaceae bacterium]
MRVGLVAVACLTACQAFDPIREVPHNHREAPTTAAAIEIILAENPQPLVYAIGEYHQSRNAIASTSPLTRFTHEIIGLLEPRADHLVVEAWLDANCWGETREQVIAKTQRSDATQMEVMRLMRRGQRRLTTHTLPMTCIEYDSVVDASGHVDFLLLLEMVTDKLAETTRSLLAKDRAVIVYGGALHNDLYPRWPLETLSYASSLAHDLGGRVLEIDLVVPEIVAPMSMIRHEPWFPLLGRASPKRVLIWQRGPASYVVILPAQSEEVAKVAKLVDPM